MQGVRNSRWSHLGFKFIPEGVEFLRGKGLRRLVEGRYPLPPPRVRQRHHRGGADLRMRFKDLLDVLRVDFDAAAVYYPVCPPQNPQFTAVKARSGKRTLAVRLGDARARRAFMLIMYLGVFCSPLTAVWLMWLQGTASGVVLLISGLPVFVVPLVSAGVRTGATTGLELVKVLRKTGLLTLYYAACAGVAVIHLLILGG